jgi:hypothetical protein
MAYDQRCADLARVFLMDHETGPQPTPAAVEALAEHIQMCIEEWIETEIKQ